MYNYINQTPRMRCSSSRSSHVHLWTGFCSFADADDLLLLYDGGRRLYYFIPMDQEIPLSEVTPLIPLDSTAIGISYDPVENQIFWSTSSGRIHQTFLNNGSSKTVVKGLRMLLGIEIDLIGRNLYFADYHYNVIKVATLDGSYQATLVDVFRPQMLALDSVSR